jgi:hypothetical protein
MSLTVRFWLINKRMLHAYVFCIAVRIYIGKLIYMSIRIVNKITQYTAILFRCFYSLINVVTIGNEFGCRNRSNYEIASYSSSFPLIFFYLVCEAIGTEATPGVLCQPRVILKMIVEKQNKWRLAGETEVLGENLPQRHFCPSQNPTRPDPGLNPGRHGRKPETKHLSYGAAFSFSFLEGFIWNLAKEIRSNRT